MKSYSKKSLWQALKNSSVMAILVLAVLALFGSNIPEQTLLISLGYAIVTFITMLPVFYLSFKNRWNEGPLLSIKRLYTPLLALAFLLTAVFIYVPLAYGHNPVDFFVTSSGKFNGEMVWILVKYSFFSVLVFYIILFLGASNEREVIVNTSLSSLKKESDETDSVPSPQKTVRLEGGTKSSVIDLDITRFLYAESDANYLKIHLFGEEHSVLSVRMTLRQFEEATAQFPEIVRCHRAFVVNIRNVTYYASQSGKGEVHFSVIEETVPVSKTYADNISRMLQQGQ